MADRIRAPEVAKRLAQSPRKIQDMAAQGLIPGAAKIGSIWTFDPDAIEAWVRKQERMACRTISTKEMVSGTDDFRPPASFDESAYEQAIFGKQKRGSRPLKTKPITAGSASGKRAAG